MQDRKWREPAPGIVFEPQETVVTAAEQAGKLEACGLDPAIMAGQVDPSFYIGIGIQAGIANGISAEGNINMMTRLTQHRPVALGESITFRGGIEAVTEVPRGVTIQTEAYFEDASGVRVIDVPRRSLKPNPAKAPSKGDGSGKPGAGERPPPVVQDANALTRVGTYTLTPEQVKSYTNEGNAIHYDMEVAQRAGFRAPIIGGGMGVHYLVALLIERFAPKHIDLELYFRRPIFWDDTFDVGYLEEGGKVTALALIRDGKVLTEARVLGVS